ncbi:hypothetical protein [Streptomyces anulatus]|uniref:Uncharacterized protein n=1 Tax=Streptomyces anulatus TaxID=1892 RepID=A0ABZ1ZW89_STRAQ|nr:hypothetical protein [Streptomyces anulatus]WST83015.1 hypothetical protein OG238_00875 [Streptomyces anulatus]
MGLRAELQHRLAPIDQHGDVDDLPRLTVVFEAADSTLRQLARHWDTIREKDDPKTSPAVDALQDVLLAGPQARITSSPPPSSPPASSVQDARTSPPRSWGGRPPVPGSTSPRRSTPPRSPTPTRATSTSCRAATPTRRRSCS